MRKIIQIKMDISYAVAKIYLRKFNEWKDVFEKNYEKFKQLNCLKQKQNFSQIHLSIH